MSQTPPKRFFCFCDDNVIGPFELIELSGLLRAKQIDATTQICREGTEQWMTFGECPEYHFALEIPQKVFEQHQKEQAHETESSWSPRKLLMFLWIMGPLLLYVIYRGVRMYLVYHLTHNTDDSAPPATPGNP